jgi:hypothetical protein
MAEALIILQRSVSADERAAIARVASVRQSISDRVFVAEIAGKGLDDLRATGGIDRVMTGSEPDDALPAMTDAEDLFVRGWLLSRRAVKSRRGEGLDWDTPPMLPPDLPPERKR